MAEAAAERTGGLGKPGRALERTVTAFALSRGGWDIAARLAVRCGNSAWHFTGRRVPSPPPHGRQHGPRPVRLGSGDLLRRRSNLLRFRVGSWTR